MEGTDTGGEGISWGHCNRLEGEQTEQQQEVGCGWGGEGSRGGGGPVNHALTAFNEVFKKKVLPDSFSKEPRMLSSSLFIGRP